MDSFLLAVSVLLFMIVAIGFANEKLTHLTYEIALLLFSIAVGAVITAAYSLINDVGVRELLESIQIFDLEKILMKGMLCFMLFAGAKNMKLRSFKENARAVSVLAFLCTLTGALFYGFLFYAVSAAFGLSFTLPMCLMLGSIVAPTDPIAATSILRKFGLPEKTGFLMEAESLLNDGVGVALFVCFSGIVSSDSNGTGFIILMVREIFGAVIMGAVVSWLCFQVILKTEDAQRRIFASLLSVSLSFFLCELLGCSGAIACVVCGLSVSTLRDKKGLQGLPEFDSFWETADVLMNSFLYVILGLSFVRIIQMPMVIILSVIAIILNFVSRYLSVFTGTFAIGEIPDGYSRNRFSLLFTWGGLRGGLCIALAMSTRSLVDTDQYNIILGCIYAVVFFTTVIQGLTMKSVYRKLSGG